jgi:hypothetical protein
LGYIGLGGAIIGLQALCAWHAVKHRRQNWLWLIFAFPVIGSLVYLFTEVQPPHRWPRLAEAIAWTVSPARRLRELRERVEESGTVENRTALAKECAEQGLFDEAIMLYRGCLTGAFKDDPVLLVGYAVAHLGKGAFAEGEAILEHVFEIAPRTRTAENRLLLARALEEQGKTETALEEYRGAMPQALGDEARCRYALLLVKAGRREEARPIFEQIVKEARRAPGHYRRAQREWIERARAALKA